jgi:imidazolonepropionase-like amidohydrolase
VKQLPALMILFAAAACPQDAPLFISGATIHPVSSPDITGSVFIQNGAIVEIGDRIRPPRNAQIVEAQGLHLYPGMIDSATILGLSEIEAVQETTDITELGDFNPQLRSIVAVNPASEHIPVTRANGITSAITAPGGGMISGQPALIHLDGWTWEEMSIVPSVAMQLRFPSSAPVDAVVEPARVED